MLCDFHTHTFLSDGELLPMELIRRCLTNGYTTLGIADHISLSTVGRVITEAKRDAYLGKRDWGIDVFVGAEITHVPAEAIDEVASKGISCGADYLVVHGETVVEPVEPGTNRSAILSGKVDILAHPGLITAEDAKLAAEHNVFLEVTCRKGHSLSNGRVVQLGREAGAKFLINTDGHAPGDLLTDAFAWTVGRGAGLSDDEVKVVLYENPKILIDRIRSRAR
jgi:histidinol phosphatase-like PHP family hydrolase